MIWFGRELQEYEFSSRREFLLSSGEDYCSSSLAGNTRKYHGLLVHRGRVLLSSLDEYLNGRRISVASYHGNPCAEGLKYLHGFSLYPLCFHYHVDGISLEKRIHLGGALEIEYRCRGDASLRLVPLLTDRSVHEVRNEPWFTPIATKNAISVGDVHLHGEGMRFEGCPLLYYGVWYREDFERGYACQENLYSPGCFVAEGRDLRCTLRAWVGKGGGPIRGVRTPGTPEEVLKSAAETFLWGDTLIAGYHWFLEPWGRDTFVSLPGLLLLQGRFRTAESLFKYFAARAKRGIIPNRVPDSYHSSDATLWFLWALKGACCSIGMEYFREEAKRYVEELLHSYGESEVAALDGALIEVAPRSTWMDTVFTPREGKPVEVNALWIEALEFAEAIGVTPPVTAKAARRDFERFWNEERSCLYDTIDPLSDAIRPNQVIALSRGLLDPERHRMALETVSRHLLTPYGLRTLSPEDPNYRGRHTGDESYHNGSVWPWLITNYVEAALRAGEDPGALRMLYRPLIHHLSEAGLGSISELFDGDHPHHPRGCISQAWSVAEVLRGLSLLSRHGPNDREASAT